MINLPLGKFLYDMAHIIWAISYGPFDLIQHIMPS